MRLLRRGGHDSKQHTASGSVIYFGDSASPKWISDLIEMIFLVI